MSQETSFRLTSSGLGSHSCRPSSHLWSGEGIPPAPGPGVGEAAVLVQQKGKEDGISPSTLPIYEVSEGTVSLTKTIPYQNSESLVLPF